MGVYIEDLTLPKDVTHIYMTMFKKDGEPLTGSISIELVTDVDLVRCGECKWCDDKGKGRALICTNPYIDMDIHPLDFCSYGERRENL